MTAESSEDQVGLAEVKNKRKNKRRSRENELSETAILSDVQSTTYDFNGAKPVVVVGDGWAAIAAVGLLVSRNTAVCWITGTGTRALPPLASIEAGDGVAALQKLATALGVDLGPSRTGLWSREFKNKSFREPAWAKEVSDSDRVAVKDGTLWAPERTFIGAWETRFDRTLAEIEEDCRRVLAKPGSFLHLRKLAGIPIQSVVFDEQKGIQSALLGSGEVIECDQIIYADRWSELPAIDGLPRPLVFLRKKDPMGVLQANFVHDPAMPKGIIESFYSTLHRDAKDEAERHVWGYFSSDGTRSTWTLCLNSSEVEDNHEITKKLRRMKNTLDKMFTANGFLPEGTANFSATVREEQVRFQEEAIFTGGSAPSSLKQVPQLAGISFLTDAYGPASAFWQVGMVLVQPIHETENVVGSHQESVVMLQADVKEQVSTL